MRQIAGLHATQ